MTSLQVDAILFDVDGTLIDDSMSYREAIRRTSEYLLRKPVTLEEVDQIKSLPGFNNDYDTTWTIVGHQLHGHITAPSDGDRGSYAYRQLRNIFQTYYLGDRLWAEISGEEPPFVWAEPLMLRESLLVAPETLEHLREFKLGIVTSRPRAEALMALKQHGLDRFFTPDVVVGAEDAPREKPHPAPLWEIVRRIDCSRPVYVGDTINDALAAMAAGMPFIYIGHGQLRAGQVEPRAHSRLGDINELPQLCGVLTPGIP